MYINGEDCLTCTIDTDEKGGGIMKISQNDVVASPRILNRQLILTFCHKDSPYSQQYG